MPSTAPKTVKAKFKVNEVTQHSGKNKTVKLQAIYGKEGENADFTQYTPSGEIRIMITPETLAYDLFTPDKEFYVNFIEIPEESKEA